MKYFLVCSLQCQYEQPLELLTVILSSSTATGGIIFTVPILAQAKSFLKMMDIRPIGTVMTKSQYIQKALDECTEILS